MRKRYTRRQMFFFVLLGIIALYSLAFFTHILSQKTKEMRARKTVASPAAVVAQVTPTPTIVPTPIPDPTESIATFFQGPKAWEMRLDWSGKWGKEYHDGGSFGGFGCGLCCMANIYCSLTPYECSPIDMYEYAKEQSEYWGGGAIDWGFMKQTMTAAGFTCDVGRKPKSYKRFQKLVKESKATIVVVSSYNSTCYWQDTPGHYVTLFLYDEETDTIFLGDSGDPSHNRQRVSLKKIYKSLKTANNWQYMTVLSYDEGNDQYKHKGFGGKCIIPEDWK